ncbi:hypothetical protein BDD12DRAFT_359399 [Trichophaea hybrida]|nr:hypothetical protein BDD12DRAFT_541435 [Trichophaea hybrida]KAF8542539.1 hypothetical protein BDD12DRAFT_359399 [Trichophaea hybrida]
MRNYQERSKPCQYYAIGRCLKGDLCTYTHDVSSRPEAQQPWRRPSVGLSSGSPQVWRRSGTVYPETERGESQKQNQTWGWRLGGGNNNDWKRTDDIETPKWRRPSAGNRDDITSVDGEDGPTSSIWRRSGNSFQDADLEKPNKRWGWNSSRSAIQGWRGSRDSDANSTEGLGVPPWRRASNGDISRDTETRGRWDEQNHPKVMLQMTTYYLILIAATTTTMHCLLEVLDRNLRELANRL